MSKLQNIFENLELYCTKHQKYFEIYEEILSKYVDKKIIVVEIGVLSGGSLLMWKKFFGEKARIIGIDLNEKAKELEKYGFEIFIGDQSNPEFWKTFFSKIGPIDILIDDGGHSNLDQIITTVNVVEKIKDGGAIVIEDTHSSYLKKFSNPSKYSFINFSKKLVDDINFKFPNLRKFNFSLNDYIYSISYFESIVCFHIDTKKCLTNEKIKNKGSKIIVEDKRVLNMGEENRIKNFIRNIFSKNILKKYFD